jgi:hypothetical protein
VQFNDEALYHDLILTDFAGRQVKKWMHVEGAQFEMNRIQLAKGMYHLHIVNPSGAYSSQKISID